MKTYSSIKANARLFVVMMISTGILCISEVRAQFVEDIQVIHTFSESSGSFGWGVADLKDIDGDNITDVIIGAPFSGRCNVYSGRTGTLIYELTPEFTGGRFGHSMADAGDVNNDGVNDIVVGANTSGSGGRVFVFSGATGEQLRVFNAEGTGHNFGFGVGGAGDVNQDGFDDVLVEAPNASPAGFDSGRAYIFSGIDGSLIRTFDGESNGNLFGNGAAGTGDVDGDGIGDQIVGAPGAGTDGKAYVFSGVDGSLIFDTFAEPGGRSYGTFFVAGAGDVNNDGTLDVYVGDFGANGGRGKAYVYSGATGDPLLVVSGRPGDGVGPGRSAGDVNNDSYDDIIVGFWTNSTGAGTAGKAVVYSGRTGAKMRSITSTTAGENMGFDAVGLGDVNGDGKIDFLVSAATQNRVYLVAGTQCDVALEPVSEPKPSRKSRYISFDPVNVGIQAAIRVTLTDLNGFAGFNGQVRWVGPPQEFPEGSNPEPTFMAAQLQCEPHYQDWGVVGMLHVYGEEVVPNSLYDVQVINEACSVTNEANYSSPLVVHTSRLGDVVEPFNPPTDTQQPTIADVLALVDKWLGAEGLVKARAQLQPEFLNPSLSVGIADILIGVDSWLGAAYPFDGPSECP